MRELARSIARANMKRAGYQRLNKKSPKTNQSPFARHWRKYVNYQPHTIVVLHHKKRTKWPMKVKRLFQRGVMNG